MSHPTLREIVTAHGDGTMIQAGCAWLSVADMVAAVESRYADGTGREEHRADYLAAVAWVGGVR